MVIDCEVSMSLGIYKVGDVVKFVNRRVKARCTNLNPQSWVCIDDTDAWADWELNKEIKVVLDSVEAAGFWILIKPKVNTKPEWL